MKRTLTLALSTLFVLQLAAFARAGDNELTPQEKKEGWMLLFNGKDHTGWMCNNGKSIATPVEDGALVPYKSGGYLIVYKKPFENFILKCDVKMPEGKCNSGIFFRVHDLKNPVHSGFEVQVLSGKGTGRNQMGAIYDLAATTKNTSKGGGVWNTFEIKCDGPMITVKLNGEQVCQLNCDELDQPGKRKDGSKHKFKYKGEPVTLADAPRNGHLGFQDHGQKVWYKNIKLKKLD